MPLAIPSDKEAEGFEQVVLARDLPLAVAVQIEREDAWMAVRRSLRSLQRGGSRWLRSRLAEYRRVRSRDATSSIGD